MEEASLTSRLGGYWIIVSLVRLLSVSIFSSFISLPVIRYPYLFAFIPNLGARLGLSEHPDENRRVFGFTLTDQDNQDIEVVLAKSNGRRLITTIGDCGAEYR